MADSSSSTVTAVKHVTAHLSDNLHTYTHPTIWPSTFEIMFLEPWNYWLSVTTA